MSWLAKPAAGLVLICVLLAAIIGYLDHRDAAHEKRGIDRQVAADIAKANQNIATRRETDAHFDKLDARALCGEFGLEWVFEDGKSFCR